MSFILPWGHAKETVEYLENALLERGVATRRSLRRLYKSCVCASVPEELRREYKYYEYWVELAKMSENHDWELYNENPIEHDAESVYFAFDPGSNTKPMYQYPYTSIYEYVHYMEMAIISLGYRTTLEDLYLDDTVEYARVLEQIAMDGDNRVMNNFDRRMWFHPMRRYKSTADIDFLEYHLLSNDLLRKKDLKRILKYSNNDGYAYIIMLQCALFTSSF